MAKQLFFDIEARNRMKKGVDILSNAVKVTLGPKGRNVVIEKKFGAPAITKDGVTVAKEIELEDPIENMGAQMVKEVASKTADIAGDGTTTATVLAQSIISEGLNRAGPRSAADAGWRASWKRDGRHPPGWPGPRLAPRAVATWRPRFRSSSRQR